jgi:hypothetical protein
MECTQQLPVKQLRHKRYLEMASLKPVDGRPAIRHRPFDVNARENRAVPRRFWPLVWLCKGVGRVLDAGWVNNRRGRKVSVHAAPPTEIDVS